MKNLFHGLGLLGFLGLVGCAAPGTAPENAVAAPALTLTPGYSVSASEPLSQDTKAGKKKAAESAVFETLRSLLKNYADGNTNAAESQIDNRMVGYTTLVAQLRQSSAGQKQIEFNLQPPRYTKAKGVYILNVSWQKRYLDTPNLTPKLLSGQSTFMFQRIDKTWKLSSLSGDNPFAL